MKDLLLTPVLTESSYQMGKESNVYVFKAPLKTSKQQIARAIEAQFSVKVTHINTTRISGKSKRVMSITGKRYSNRYGRQSEYKKAFVSLKEGDKLPILESIDEAEKKKEEAQAKYDKALATQTEKETKKASKPSVSPIRRFLRTKKPEGS